MLGRLQKFMKHRLAVIGFIIVAGIFFMLIFAPLLTQFSPDGIDLRGRTLSPGTDGHLLGTDKIGRDVFARLLYGGRMSVLISVTSAVFTTVIGAMLGCVSGYTGGLTDRVLLRTSEIISIFPRTILIMVMVAFVPRGVGNLIFIFILTGWMPVYRLVRSRLFSLREETFVDALRVMGIGRPSIMFKHILPNTLGPVMVNLTLQTAAFILTEAALSFIGLGVPSGTPTWGNILNAAKEIDILTRYPWLWIPCGLMIALFVMGINFFGDGLRDVLDPRQVLRGAK